MADVHHDQDSISSITLAIDNQTTTNLKNSSHRKRITQCMSEYKFFLYILCLILKTIEILNE